MSITRRCCNRVRNAAARTTKTGTYARAPASVNNQRATQQRRWNRSNAVQHPSAARTAAPGTDEPSLQTPRTVGPYLRQSASPHSRRTNDNQPNFLENPQPPGANSSNQDAQTLISLELKNNPTPSFYIVYAVIITRAAPSPSNFVVGLNPHGVPLQEVGAVA